MTVVFCPSFKIGYLNPINHLQLLRLYRKFSSAIGGGGENFKMDRVLMIGSKGFTKFAHTLNRATINVCRFIGSGNVNNFQLA